MDATTIILGIVLIILLYILYKYLTTDKALLQEYVHLMQDDLKPITDLEKPKTPRYAYGFWIYVNTWDSSQDKIIFIREGNMSCYLDSNTASLSLRIMTGTSAAGGTSQVIQMSDNFPMQKWVHCIVSVDNEYVDCYLDGKLIRSSRVYSPGGGSTPALIPSIPPDNSIPVNLGGNSFDAYVSKFKRWLYPINPQTAYDEYMKGNGQSSFGLPSYGLDLTVLKDNEVYKELSVF